MRAFAPVFIQNYGNIDTNILSNSLVNEQLRCERTTKAQRKTNRKTTDESEKHIDIIFGRRWLAKRQRVRNKTGERTKLREKTITLKEEATASTTRTTKWLRSHAYGHGRNIIMYILWSHFTQLQVAV